MYNGTSVARYVVYYLFLSVQMVVFSIIYGYAVAIGAINIISVDEEIGSVLLLKLK